MKGFSGRVGSGVTAPGKKGPELKQQGDGSGPYFFLFEHYEIVQEETGGARHNKYPITSFSVAEEFHTIQLNLPMNPTQLSL
jgi:hypothetical protein